jgi:hypothetical protein
MFLITNYQALYVVFWWEFLLPIERFVEFFYRNPADEYQYAIYIDPNNFACVSNVK